MQLSKSLAILALIFAMFLNVFSPISVSAMATNWLLVDGGSGLNLDSSQSARSPNLTVFDNALYATWSEDNGTTWQIRVKKYDGTSWIAVDGGGSIGLNMDSSKYVDSPNLAVFNNALYVTWLEDNGTSMQIRIKKYDGISWTFVDGGGSTGLNEDSLKEGASPNLAVYNNALYVTWSEFGGTETNKIRVKRYNGTSWITVDGGGSTGLNMDSSKSASSPNLGVYNNALYAIWSEYNGTAKQIRVKKYDGNSWITVDGGGNTGLNADSSKAAGFPNLTVFNNALYATWSEYNETTSQIRVKKYDGTSWIAVDGGGSTGLNVDSTQGGNFPDLGVFNDFIYATWSEFNITTQTNQIRVKQYNGTSWIAVDGDINGLNVDPIGGSASNSNLAVFNNALYATWTEYTDANQIRVASYSVPPTAPTGLNAAIGDGQAVLNWNSVSGATSYKVYQRTSTGTYVSTAIATVSGTTYNFTVTGLTNATPYYFAVKASNDRGDSLFSTETSAIPQVGVPTAPTGLNAAIGDGQAVLNWNSVTGATSYKVYQGTSTGTYGSTAVATVSGTTYNFTVTGLTNATPYYFAIKASNDGGDSSFSTETTATPTRVSISTPISSSSYTPTSSTEMPPLGFRVIVDGKRQNHIATGSTTVENGKNMLTVTIDATKLADPLADAGDKPIVTIFVMQSADKVSVVLTGDAVKAMENKQAVLEVQTPNGSYKLPASEFSINQLSNQLGQQVSLADIVVNVYIAKSDDDKVTLIGNKAIKNGYTVMAAPIDFTVSASYIGKTVDVDKFKLYIEREIPLPDGVDPSEITTAVVFGEDGTTHHVPTYVMARDGKYVAVINSLTNSMYVLIWHPIKFADVEGHWSKDAVNNMASRMVVNGVDESHYMPNAAITRAEFAAIIVRALGLADNEKTAAFADVKSGDWYIGAVAKAHEYGIIEGYEDGTFRPTQTITREEALLMISRAMKLVGLETNLNGADMDAALSPFGDRNTINTWAKQAVAATVKQHLVKGSDTGLMPKSNITRAETAAIVQRMLEKAKLIDSINSK